MRWRLLATLAFAWQALASVPPPAPEFDYELSPVVENGRSFLDITLRFIGSASGRLQLDLPNEGEGERGRWRFLSGFAVSGALVEAPDPATRLLSFAPGAEVTVRYRVATAYDTDPDGRNGN